MALILERKYMEDSEKNNSDVVTTASEYVSGHAISGLKYALQLIVLQGDKLEKSITKKIKQRIHRYYSVFSRYRLKKNPVCSEVDSGIFHLIGKKSNKIAKYIEKGDIENANKIAFSVLSDLDKYETNREEIKK